MNSNIIAKDSDYIYDPDHKKHPSGGYHKTEKGWSRIEEKKDESVKKNESVKKDKLVKNESVKKHKEVSNGRKIEHDFRTVQRECLSMSDAEVESYHSGSRKIDEGLRGRLQGIFRRKLAADSRRNGNGYESLVNPKTNKSVKFHKKVSGDTFHSIFEICHKYLPMGDCVDVHDKKDYDDTDNYMSEDGMSGFSITKEGDLISVFSLSKEGGFLSTIAPIVKEKAKTLDCFSIGDNGLPTLYEKYFGFQTASVLEFNEDVLREDKGDEYTDNFIKNYGKPSVHFMVNSKKPIESKKFDKDDWDGAFSYQQSKKAYKIISKLVQSFMVNKIAKSITKSYSASKDVDQIRDNGGKQERKDLSRPSRSDLKKQLTKRDVLREDRDDYKDTLFDKDLKLGNIAIKIAEKWKE